MRALLALLCLVAATLAAAAEGDGTNFPNRPVKIVVPFPAGGPTDVNMRILGQKLSELWGQGVVIENRPGANTGIGAQFVAKSSPDGYTLLAAMDTTLVMNPATGASMNYDPFKDFAAICELAVSPNVFAVQPSLGVNSMKEFVALAKKDPAKFNVSAPPIGTTPQLEAEVLKAREGLHGMATVVFAGGGDAPEGARETRQGDGHHRGATAIHRDVLHGVATEVLDGLPDGLLQGVLGGQVGLRVPARRDAGGVDGLPAREAVGAVDHQVMARDQIGISCPDAARQRGDANMGVQPVQRLGQGQRLVAGLRPQGGHPSPC